MKQCGLGAYQEKAVVHLGEEVIMEHEDAATLSGRMALSLVAHRIRRSLWLVESYPVSLLRLLHPDAEVASRCLQDFKLDYEIFTRLAKTERPTAVMRAVLARSVFQLISVKQVVSAFEESGWALTPGIRQMLERRSLVIASTQVVEDTNSLMTSDRDRPGNSRWRRPQSGMAAALAGKVLEHVHEYTPVVVDIPLPRRSIVIEKKGVRERGGGIHELPADRQHQANR